MSEFSASTSSASVRRSADAAPRRVVLSMSLDSANRPAATPASPVCPALGGVGRGAARAVAHGAVRAVAHGAARDGAAGASRDGARGAARDGAARDGADRAPGDAARGASRDTAHGAARATLSVTVRHPAAQVGPAVAAPPAATRPPLARACVLATPGPQGAAPRHGARRAAVAPPREAVADAQAVLYRLEEAGRALLALPNTGYTTRLRLNAIEFVRSALTGEGWDTRADTPTRLRPAMPDSARITRMDEALAWIGLIPHDRYVLRRIVGCRALVSPTTERHLFPWRRIGLLIGADHKAVQRWHAQGIDLIVAALAARR